MPGGLMELDKIVDGTVERLFCLCREKTGWNLSFLPVVADAFAAKSGFVATRVGAVASFHVHGFVGAFH